MMMAPRFVPLRLDAIEAPNVCNTFGHGLHKLGFGGSSTVWLARDQQEERVQSRIVTLKAMRANVSSSKVPSEIPELAISLPPSESVDFQTTQLPSIMSIVYSWDWYAAKYAATTRIQHPRQET